MLFRNIVPTPKGTLSLHQALELCNIYLENAYKSADHDIALILCHDAEAALSQVKGANKRRSADPKDVGYKALREGVATAYIDLGKLLENRGYQSEAQAIRKKAEKWGGNPHNPGRLAQAYTNSNVQLANVTTSSRDSQATGSLQTMDRNNHPNRAATVLANVFAENIRPPTIEFKLPETDERLGSTPQLVCCLALLQASHSPDDTLGPVVQEWLQITAQDADEQERLYTLAVEVLRTFKRDELKDTKSVAEVVCLAPILHKDAFQELLRELYSGINHSGLLNCHQLEGLARLIQDADPGYLSPDDLVKVLELLSSRLRGTHQGSAQHVHQLTLAISQVLDAMADTHVSGLDREKLHEPLSSFLNGLKNSSDPFLVYQAAYAHQALLCVPDDEKVWQGVMRRTKRVIRGVSGLVSAVKGLDLNKFIEGLEDIHKGLEGASKVTELVHTAYKDVTSLAQSGQGFLDCLKEGFSFERKRDWYTALRVADTLLQDGELSTFKVLVCTAPCRRDPAFQWGVCQRLGEIAINPMWDSATRRSAVTFLGELYKNDDLWGRQPSIKQWILNILMRLASSPDSDGQVAATQLKELETNGDDKKQALYRQRCKEGPIAYPLKVALPELASPSLLDRVQNRTDVESSLRMLRKRRTKNRGHVVYIPPQAKGSLQAADDTRFPLMEKVKEFLDTDQKVFLLIGDSGAGKSTYNRELEFELWQTYRNKAGRIPLYINLPSIEKPEYDMIAKQLRKADFTESQIREMKHYHKFILICDGYDESQQVHNLYMSNQLNQPGEWDAQMVISCRTEYLGSDYRDRFQPSDRNRQSDPSLFQEAVMIPFTLDQVQDYIQQYVSIHQPLWRVEDYNHALELIPSLKELVRNPFLMALSLDVLPRMVDPGQNLSSAHVTRVVLYDHFVEQWLERGKKRIGEDLSSHSRAAFENLIDEGFTQHGIEFLKALAVAIYKEQAGHPVVTYSSIKGEHSWKDTFFGREDEKQLLREACPLVRNGNQFRFIHRSLLEYALALDIFDPQDGVKAPKLEVFMGRRGSTSSIMSFESQVTEEQTIAQDQEPDINSPLAWRNMVNDHSLLQFLEERVQQGPVFRKQLLGYIEYSKKDKKWRKAAANAITILVRAGLQFIGTDLRGIQIPGADLSHGVFDSVKLQDADLRKTNLRGVLMRQTYLDRAAMAGAQFGELPSLTDESEMRSCGYSKDGESFAVGLNNGDINLFTTSDWERFRVLQGHTEMVWRVIFSPSGNQIASSSVDKTVRLWDVATGVCGLIFTSDTISDYHVHGIAYSIHGDLIATATVDGTVRLWDVVTGDCRQILLGHDSWVTSVSFSPKGRQIASGGGDFTVRLWNLESGFCSSILLGHDNNVWDVTYSPQGDQIASAGQDKTVRIWDVATGTCCHVLAGHNGTVYGVAYSPNGNLLASGGVDGSVRLWDTETGACRTRLNGHRTTVYGVAFSPKGVYLSSASFDKTARLWDVSIEGSRFVSGGHSSEVATVKHSPKGDRIASGSVDCTIQFWEMDSGVCRQTLRGHNGSVFSIAYSPHGNHMASGSGDTTVRIWDMETGTCQHILTGHSDWVSCVVYSSEGDWIISGSKDKTLRVWEAKTGTYYRTLIGHAEGVLGVACSPKRHQVASGSKDCTVRLWDVGTGVCSHILIGHSGLIKDLAFSPQGDLIASGSGDNTIRLWDVEGGSCNHVLSGHTDVILSISFASSGKLLASGSLDRTMRLWDVASGQCRAVVQSFQGYVFCMDWSTVADTNYLYTGCEDGSVLKWQAMEEEEQCEVQLCWSATSGVLTMMGASIQGVHGLTPLNIQLLKQRGAIGEPGQLLGAGVARNDD